MKAVGAICAFMLCGLGSIQAAQSQYLDQNQGQNGQFAAQNGGQAFAPPSQPANSAPATNAAQLKQWFSRYDQVRKQAQMTAGEKDRADNILSQGLSIFIAGPNKVQAQKLLTGLVSKYQVAIGQMKGLPLYPETSKLHRGYYQYFSDARTLFSDYLLVQNDLMAKDPRTGKRVMPQLMERKNNLENLERQIKQLDGELRSQYGIARYNG